MVIDLTPEQEALIQDTARHEGKSVGEVVADTLRWFACNEEANRMSIQRGIDQADRGEFIEEEEMNERLAKLLKRR